MAAWLLNNSEPFLNDLPKIPCPLLVIVLKLVPQDKPSEDTKEVDQNSAKSQGLNKQFSPMMALPAPHQVAKLPIFLGFIYVTTLV